MGECWASGHGKCGSTSREHYISDGIFDGEMITAFGLPWCKDKPKTIGLASAVAKILCDVHNSALSPFDSEASKLSKFLSTAVYEPSRGMEADLSGPLLERWAIKTLLNLAHIGALDPVNHARVPAPPEFVEVLFGNAPIPEGAGLYFVTGTVNNHNYRPGLSWNTLFNPREGGGIVGMAFTLNGVHFVVTIVPIKAEKIIARLRKVGAIDFPNAKVFYRPPNIVFGAKSTVRHKVNLRW